jgi:hypothetical protein
MKGQYLKNCNCIASCPCDTGGYPYPGPGCQGVIAMRILEGQFDGTKLDGVIWGGVARWPGALHEGNGELTPFIDEKATEDQRNAILTIASGQAGGPLFEILAQVVSTIHDPVFASVEFAFDLEKRTARLRVPGLLETESEPLKVPATGDEQRVIVSLPGGFEYKEMEVANCKVLKTEGAIILDHTNTHSSLAEVDHTPAGLGD